MSESTNQIASIRTKPFAHHSVAFSPFQPKLLALASSANYGLVGNGRLHVVSQGHPPLPGGGGGFDASTLRVDRAYRTQDGLYDLAWSELHENQIVSASGDGSLRLWDITMTVRPTHIPHPHTPNLFPNSSYRELIGV
ncbi:peroxisomal targeting signal 2 receptor [Ceratobasidium sp. 392]|nr:peroxisomal targeting signal 2 receptor [Ceratobasidium sp. 392]